MAIPTKKRAAAYIRMSTQQQENSPERQREQIDAYARQKGYSIVRWYEDQGMKGWDTTWPSYKALLRDAEEGVFEVIVADELSRLGTLDYFTQFVAPLSQAGVVVDTVSEGLLTWDDEDLGGAILQLVKSHKGFSETLYLGERTVKGLCKLARKGRLFVGPRPFGMDYCVDDERTRTGYVPGPPDEVNAVQFMFRRYSEGASLADIAADLNEKGVLTCKKKPWTRSSVHAVLTNPVYAGDYVFGRVARGKFYRVSGSSPQGHVRRRKKAKTTKYDIQRVPPEDWLVLRDTHTGIIDRDLFDRVQALLKANRKYTSPSRPRGQHPLSGLLYCPGCGHVMYGTTRKLKECLPVYVCGRYIRNRQCQGYWIREDEALASIAYALQEQLSDPDKIRRLTASTARLKVGLPVDDGARTEQLRQQVRRLDAQLVQAKARLARVPVDLFDNYLAEIRLMEAERDEAEGQLAKASKPVDARQGPDDLVAKVKRLSEAIGGVDADLIHGLLKNIVERVDLNFRVIPLAKNKRFICETGNITVRQSSVLSVTGPGPR